MRGRRDGRIVRRSPWLGVRLVTSSMVSVLVLAMSIVSLGASVGAQDAPVASSAADVVSVAEAENTALRAQLDQMRRSDDQILQTVYWALGVLATVVALLVGFGWFSNMRLADNDRRQFRGEMGLELAKLVADAEGRMDQRLTRIEHRAIEAVDAKLAESGEEHRRRFNEIQSELTATQYAFLETMARTELGLGNANEALDVAATMIAIGVRAELDAAIAGGLNLVQTALSQGARPSVALVAEINRALDGLPQRYATDREVVGNLLADVRSRMNITVEWES